MLLVRSTQSGVLQPLHFGGGGGGGDSPGLKKQTSADQHPQAQFSKFPTTQQAWNLFYVQNIFPERLKFLFKLFESLILKFSWFYRTYC